MKSSQAGQLTSIVVLSWRCAKDSDSPRSEVDMPQWDRVIWTCNGIVTMCETRTNTTRMVQVGSVLQSRQYPNKNQ